MWSDVKSSCMNCHWGKKFITLLWQNVHCCIVVWQSWVNVHMYMWAKKFNPELPFVHMGKKVHHWIAMCTRWQESSSLNCHACVGTFYLKFVRSHITCINCGYFFSSLLIFSGTTNPNCHVVLTLLSKHKFSHFQNICLVNVFQHYVWFSSLCYPPRTKTDAF